MVAPARVELSAAMNVKDWYLDVDTGYPGASTWAPVSGIMSFKAPLAHTTKDATTFDSGGAMASQKTADQWSIEAKLKRAPQAADLDAYDVGQEHLRTKSNLYGAANLVKVRWYEVNGAGYPLTEAWEGVASCEWSEDADAQDDIRQIALKLTGHGKRTPVSPNPASV